VATSNAYNMKVAHDKRVLKVLFYDLGKSKNEKAPFCLIFMCSEFLEKN
jgi:hypothetical protein